MHCTTSTYVYVLRQSAAFYGVEEACTPAYPIPETETVLQIRRCWLFLFLQAVVLEKGVLPFLFLSVSSCHHLNAKATWENGDPASFSRTARIDSAGKRSRPSWGKIFRRYLFFFFVVPSLPKTNFLKTGSFLEFGRRQRRHQQVSPLLPLTLGANPSLLQKSGL